MKKKLREKIIFYFMLAAFVAQTFTSCSEDSEPVTIPVFPIESVYGFTFSTTFTSSSGNSLSPEITVFNSERIDWTMSSGSMGNNKFYYTAESDSLFPNVWTMYWYSSLSSFNSGDTSKAAMKIKFGINALESISVLVMDNGNCSGASMAGTALTMKKVSGFYNTAPGEISDAAESITDTTISVKGEKTDWFELSTSFTGSYDCLVGEDGCISKIHADCSDGEIIRVVIKKTSDGLVSVHVPAMNYGGFNLESFMVTDVQVSAQEETFYLSKDSFVSSASGCVINGTSLKGEYKDGVLLLRYVFTPGKMPFPITVIFTSEQNE